MENRNTEMAGTDFIIEHKTLLSYHGREKNIVIPDTVTIIGKKAFQGCEHLITVEIPDSVTKIGARAFSGCSRLNSISIPDSVTEIGAWAFLGCRCLNNLSIPCSVRQIGTAAFSGCSHLRHIIIPDSVTTIGSWLFMDCSRLNSITLPGSITGTIAANMFDSCPELEEIIIQPNSQNYISKDGVLFKKTASDLELIFYPANKKGQAYTIPDDVTSIASNAFLGCHELITLSIPDSVTAIGTDAFCNCSHLAKISCRSHILQKWLISQNPLEKEALRNL